MSSLRIANLIFAGLLYLVVQVLILKNLVLFGVAFCFLHVLFILLLPIEVKTIATLLLSFVFGMLVDLFYDTLGIHTIALLAVAFVRQSWLGVLVPSGGYEDDLSPSLVNMGLGWFLSYSIPLFLLYHILFFFIETLGTDLFFSSIQKIIASTIFALLISIITQLLFYKKRRGV